MRRADLAERIDTMEHRMDSMEQRLDASFNALMAEILQSRRENDVAHSAMRTEFARDMSTFRSEVAGQFSAMGARVDKLEAAMDASRADVAGEFSNMRGRLESLETAMVDGWTHFETSLANGLEENRRFMMVLHEETLARIAWINEGRPSSS